jgi:hypothetical protein
MSEDFKLRCVVAMAAVSVIVSGCVLCDLWRLPMTGAVCVAVGCCVLRQMFKR